MMSLHLEKRRESQGGVADIYEKAGDISPSICDSVTPTIAIITTIVPLPLAADCHRHKVSSERGDASDRM